MRLIIEYIQCYWIPFALGALTAMSVKYIRQWREHNER